MLQTTGSEFALLNPACFKNNRANNCSSIKTGVEEGCFIVWYLSFNICCALV